MERTTVLTAFPLSELIIWREMFRNIMHKSSDSSTSCGLCSSQHVLKQHANQSYDIISFIVVLLYGPKFENVGPLP